MRALVLLTVILATPLAAAPARIVSLNLCADQYLLALADRRQIAAVTYFAADRALSAAAGAAAGVPATRARAEELLMLAPDLVLVAPYQAAATAARLPDARIVAVPDAADLATIERNIGIVAGAIGHPDRGRALVAAMRTRLGPASPPRGLIAAYYQRRAYLTGAGTLVDDLMRRAGFDNLAAKLGRPALSRLPLEAIIAADPDYLILARRPQAANDQGTALLDHPALAAAIPAARRLHLDEALTVCGGPAYPDAVAALRTQLAAATPSAAPPRLRAHESSSPARR